MRLLLFAVLLAVLLAACGRPTGPIPNLVETVFVSPTSIHAGDSVAVQVTLSNDGGITQSYESACAQVFHVLNAAGTQIDSPLPCASGSIPKALVPGAQAVFHVEWVTDNPAAGSGTSAVPLAAGKYSLKGGINGAGGASVEFVPLDIQITP